MPGQFMKWCSTLLRSALRAQWLCGALIALLLAAQHGALTHALMHAGWQAHGGIAQADAPASTQLIPDTGNPASKATAQCVFDPVFSQVLAVVLITVLGFQVPAGIFDDLARRMGSRVAADPPPFLAQGPPALL